MTTESGNPVSNGVQELIDRLREDGVQSGRQAGEKIIADAEHRANWLLEQARDEARLLKEQAQAEADFMRTSGQEALQLALRDTVLSLKGVLLEQFAAQVQSLVTEQLADPELIRQMIVEIAAANRPQTADAATLILPRDKWGLDELREDPEQLSQGALADLVRELAREMLVTGIEFDIADQQGLRLQLQQGQIEVDLTDEAITELLLRHLQPRFRVLLQGIIG